MPSLKCQGRFLDLDLDFFLDEVSYCQPSDSGKPSNRKPWSASRVRRFLEKRCGLSRDAPVQGRTLESHDRVFDFWRALVEAGCLRVPFEVVHVDAHPDLWVGGGLYLASGFLYVGSQRRPATIDRGLIHPGNYLTFAIACGWIASLVWVCLREHPDDLSGREDGPRPGLAESRKSKGEREPGVLFRVIPWQKFRASETFDYIALSRSLDFTPPESDELVPVVEGYMRKM